MRRNRSPVTSQRNNCLYGRDADEACPSPPITDAALARAPPRPYDSPVKSPSLAGTLEYAVMVALWDLGSATTREVHARVGEPAGLAYTTMATVLDRLHAKGCCSRVRVGRMFSYRPEIGRVQADLARAQETLSRLIGQDALPAIVSLVDAVESLDPELLDELARITAERRKARDGS
jgi:predicted transcriptional regulator